jgi:hypothetical protein
MPTLTITPTPYRSSHLTIPTTPFTPRLPISPPPRPQVKSSNSNSKIVLSVPPPPQEPLKWLWKCHCCSRIYHLGTTRRCLDDGHYFCAGAPVTKRDRKTGQKVTRKSRACASEFDYQGWKSWGSWRRDVDEQRALAEALLTEDVALDVKSPNAAAPSSVVPRPLFAPAVPQEGHWFQGIWTRKPAVAAAAPTAPAPADFWTKDCWNTCDYPSECRWGKQFGQQQTRAQSCSQPSTSPTTASDSLGPPPPASMVAEPAVGDLGAPSSSFEGLCSMPATIEEAMESEAITSSPSATASDATTAAAVQETTTKKPTFDDLLESAKRRKRRSAGPLPSPLASNPPSPVEQQFPENALTLTSSHSASESASASASASGSSTHTLAKAFDDFELDVRKSIGRASLLLNDFVLGLKPGSAPASEEEKADAFVRGLITSHHGKRKKNRRGAGGEEDRQDDRSLSD